MREPVQRNMIQRLDRRMVNAGRKRDVLIVCTTGCCGHTNRSYPLIWAELYHVELLHRLEPRHPCGAGDDGLFVIARSHHEAG